MGRKTSLPHFYIPCEENPDLNSDSDEYYGVDGGRHGFFLCSSFQISLMDMQGEILGVRTIAQRSWVQTECENSRKDGASAEKTEGKQAKCDCAVESCSPRFTVILGITTLFNNSGRTGEGKKKTCSRLRTHENDGEEKNLTTRLSQDFKFWRFC